MSRIPLPGMPGAALLSGIDTGGQLFSRIMQPIIQRQQLAQQAPLVQAQTQKELAQTKFLPLMNLATLQNALTNQARMNQMASRFGSAYQVTKLVNAMSPAARAQWLSVPGNVETLQQAIQVVGSQMAPGAQVASPTGNLSNLIQQEISKIYPEMNAPAQSQPTLMRSPTSSPMASPVSAPPKEAIQFPTLTPQQSQGIQQIAASEALKKSQTSQQMNQRLFSNTARMLYNHGEQFVPALSEFSGIQGKIKLAKNISNAAVGNPVDPAYTDYLKFLQTNIAFANDMRRVLGGQATDSESRLMGQFTLPNLLTMTPNQVLQLRENLNDILSRQEDILSKSPAAQQISMGASLSEKKEAPKIGIDNDPLGLR